MTFALGTTTGTGSITIEAGSNLVTGIGTNFIVANIGAIIVVGAQWGVITAVASTTAVTIDRPFATAVTNSAYTISANIPIIAQTGTDTDLSGLTGVPGVTVSTNLWTITSAVLQINGSLTINRLTNRFRFLNPASIVTSSTTIPVISFGAAAVFNNSVAQISGGYSYNSPNYSFLIDVTVSNVLNITGTIMVGNVGSNVVLEGNIEFTNSQPLAVLMFQFNGTTVLQNGALLNSSPIGSNIILFYANVSTANLMVNKYSSYGVSLRVANNTTTINNYAAVAGVNAINLNTTSPVDNAQYFGLQDLGNTTALRAAGNSLKYFQVLNFSSTALAPGYTANSGAGTQVLLVNQLSLSAKGALGNIPNVKFWAKDSNNGSRYTANYGAGKAYQINTTGDLTYTATTDANGVAPTLNVVSAVYYQPTNTTFAVDYRGNNGAQDLNIYQCAYNYSLSNSPSALWPLKDGVYGGASVRNQGFVLLLDTSITQAVIATVAAYTSLDTAAQFYDYAKFYLYTNFAGQTQTYVSIAGNVINAGAYNITLDPSASLPMSISGNTITIKSTIFSGNLITTGTVTLNGGATVPGGYTDSTGVKAPITITNLVIGSAWAVINAANGAVINSGVAASTSVTFLYAWTSNISVIVRARYYGAIKYLPYEASATITSTGLSISVGQQLDTIGN